MVSRCHNEQNNVYRYYGGRGITVCSRWQKSFKVFVRDMGLQPFGYSIERVDNDKGYTKANCKWIPRGDQPKNQRTNRRLTINNETLHLAEWARRTGLKETTITYRIKLGWDVESALSVPVTKGVLKPADVVEIRTLLEDGNPYRDVAEQFGVNFTTVGRIGRGEAWQDVE